MVPAPISDALANNGGPTQTIALVAGSPAIDAGSNSWADAYGVTTDQRGAVRGGQPDAVNAGHTVDIGAYEASSSYLVTTTADSTAIGTLRSAILWADASTNANPANLASPRRNTIDFDIPTSDPGYERGHDSSWTITPTSPLPAISASTTINGYSQPGFGPATRPRPIVLSGTEAGQGSDGLDLTGNDISMLGLLINGFSGDGIDIASSDNTTPGCERRLRRDLHFGCAQRRRNLYHRRRQLDRDRRPGRIVSGCRRRRRLHQRQPRTGDLAERTRRHGQRDCRGCRRASAFANGQAGLLIDDGASDNWIGVNSVYGPESADDSRSLRQ